LFAEAFGQHDGRQAALDRLAEYFMVLLLRAAMDAQLITGGILRITLMCCFGLLRKGAFDGGSGLTKEEDEILASVKIAAPAPTDEVLVAAAKSGDHPAFLELWARHSNRAFKTAYRQFAV
jgi:hypothetical protein